MLRHEAEAADEDEFIVTDPEGNLLEDEELAQQILDDFLAFAKRRQQVFEQTIPQVLMLKQQHQALMAAAQLAQINAAAHNMADIANSVNISGHDSRARQWDSLSGGYRTAEDMQAKAGWNRSQQLLMQGQMLTRQMAMLEDQWGQVR